MAIDLRLVSRHEIIKMYRVLYTNTVDHRRRRPAQRGVNAESLFGILFGPAAAETVLSASHRVPIGRAHYSCII